MGKGQAGDQHSGSLLPGGPEGKSGLERTFSPPLRDSLQAQATYFLAYLYPLLLARTDVSLERRAAAPANYPAKSCADLTVSRPLWSYQVHLTDEGSEVGQGGAPCPHGQMENQWQQGVNPN